MVHKKLDKRSEKVLSVDPANEVDENGSNTFIILMVEDYRAVPEARLYATDPKSMKLCNEHTKLT